MFYRYNVFKNQLIHFEYALDRRLANLTGVGRGFKGIKQKITIKYVSILIFYFQLLFYVCLCIN